ncbi:unnamed protein product [Blepharisma stoltei]|uniref:Uncharacterized protein n=1 Tax=Blepharisma stoltei TaxID=1481888 RepID=A0AAU9JP45_9CILI|nr:unnamed protein product [Blepharisma stoltei]
MNKLPNLTLSSIQRPRSIEPSSRNLNSSATYRRLHLMIRDRDTSRFLDLSYLTPTNMNSSSDPFDISAQLKTLHKTFNQTTDKTSRRQKTLKALTSELAYLKQVETDRSLQIEQFKAKSKELSNKIKKIQEQVFAEEDNLNTYFHMQQRMLETIRLLDLQRSFIRKNLELQKLSLSSKKFENLKKREDKMRTKFVLEKLRAEVKLQKTDRIIEIGKLDRDLREKHQILEETEKRREHNSFLLEHSIVKAIADSDEELRESVLFHKFWDQFLTNYFEKEKKKNKKLESAFRKIRMATGVTDIREIVDRLIHKKDENTELAAEIAQKEKECNYYEKKIEMISKGVAAIDASPKNSLIPLSGSQQLQEVRKELEELLKKKKELLSCSSKIKLWSDKMRQRMKSLKNSESAEKIADSSLKTNFESLKNLSVEILSNFSKNSPLKTDDARVDTVKFKQKMFKKKFKKLISDESNNILSDLAMRRDSGEVTVKSNRP